MSTKEVTTIYFLTNILPSSSSCFNSLRKFSFLVAIHVTYSTCLLSLFRYSFFVHCYYFSTTIYYHVSFVLMLPILSLLLSVYFLQIPSSFYNLMDLVVIYHQHHHYHSFSISYYVSVLDINQSQHHHVVLVVPACAWNVVVS